MKRNSFDLFMINNFSNVIKQSKSVSISPNEVVDNDVMSMTFMGKSSGMRVPKVRTGLVLLITSESLGENNDLGINLMKNCLFSISEGIELPEYIFFINTGVKLISDESVLANLEKIKKYGSNIITSMESLVYFKLNNCKVAQKWAIGDIMSILVNANKVIRI